MSITFTKCLICISKCHFKTISHVVNFWWPLGRWEYWRDREKRGRTIRQLPHYIYEHKYKRTELYSFNFAISLHVPRNVNIVVSKMVDSRDKYLDSLLTCFYLQPVHHGLLLDHRGAAGHWVGAGLSPIVSLLSSFPSWVLFISYSTKIDVHWQVDVTLSAI